MSVSSAGWYTLLIALVGVERVAELAISRRNVRRALRHGGVEYGFAHYPVMVLLHVGLLVGCLLEVWVGGAPFTAGFASDASAGVWIGRYDPDYALGRYVGAGLGLRTGPDGLRRVITRTS